MATPLAAALLIALTAGALDALPPALPGPGAAAPCPLMVWDPAAKAAAKAPESAPVCQKGLAIRNAFNKLRDRAGFTDATLALTLQLSADDNASFIAGDPLSLVSVNSGFLDAPGRTRMASLYMLAHEIGHAVQNRGPEGPERTRRWAELWSRNRGVTSFDALPPAEKENWLAFSRRFEGQADGIAQQLLVEAGYPAEVHRMGTGDFFGCRNPQPPSSHPAASQRVVNATFGQGVIARHSALSAAPGAFDGALARAGEVVAPVRHSPRPFVPVAKLSDYDDRGVLLPGRLASSDLRIEVPPREAGVVRTVAQYTAQSFVDRWVADPFQDAVNRLAQGSPATRAVLEACGKPQAAQLSEELTTWGWTTRIVQHGASGAANWLFSLGR